MYIHQIEKPYAFALLDKRNVAFYNFSSSEVVIILSFLSISSIIEVYIAKYKDVFEFNISIQKTNNLDEKLQSLHQLSTIVSQLTKVESYHITNTQTSLDYCNQIQIKCKRNAINH
ncbi:hypothetical protein C8N46_11385 [Kordia periserrulae]|uniref:Uncharacterized protein n=1 Tax=Kordia periserrulae TaxID=701523 RepID=A0A2T6BRC4_9FLAO|nr:hypothetical protein C8N46_11385 [Kordia periserrulae]